MKEKKITADSTSLRDQAATGAWGAWRRSTGWWFHLRRFAECGAHRML